MQLQIEISRKDKCPVNVRQVTGIASRTLRETGLDLKDKRIALSVAFVSVAEIRSLNSRFRKKDAATDVLSFGEYKSVKSILKDHRKEIFLGEIILCCPIIKKSATMNGITFFREVSFVLSHGILHLLGFRHSIKMYEIQDRVAQ